MTRKSPFLYGTATLALIAGAIPAAGIAEETVTYTYDALGRLVVVRASGSVNANTVRSLCYDAADNRTEYRASTVGASTSCSGVPTPTPTPTPSPTPAPSPSIAIANAMAGEGGVMNFSVSLSAAISSSISVSYATAYGSAGSSDFYASSGSLTFSPGQTAKTISVSTKQDSLLEATETFTVNLSNPTAGATIADGQAVGSIIDDDELDDPMCGNVFC